MKEPTIPDSVILTIRGQKVLLDADLAAIYEVETKRMNEQVKRNAARFPEDFMFRLTREESAGVQASRSQIATLKPESPREAGDREDARAVSRQCRDFPAVGGNRSDLAEARPLAGRDLAAVATLAPSATRTPETPDWFPAR